MSSSGKRAVHSSYDNRVVISDLCKSLTSQMNGQERKVYDEAYRNAISTKTSVHDLTVGCIPIMILISAIESGLNACQSSLDQITPQPVGKYWNPTIAALLRALGQMSGPGQSKPASKPRDKPSKKPGLHNVDDSVPVTSRGSQSKETKASFSDVVKKSSKQHKGDSPPRSPAYQPDESPPQEKESSLDCVDSLAIRRELHEFLATFKGPYIRHLKSACTRAECSFCRELVRHVAITKCEGHTPCQASGWYPHVGKLLWEMLRRKHDKGIPYVPKASQIKLKSNELEPLRYDLCSNDTQNITKRKATDAGESEFKVLRVGVSPTLASQVCTDTDNWADDVSESWTQQESCDSSDIARD